MKRLSILILLLVIFLFFGIVVFPQKNNLKIANTITPTKAVISGSEMSPTSFSVPFCTPKDLQPTISTEGAAGNIYGTLTVKNISSKACEIQGDRFISASYAASNITVKPTGQMGPALIILQPNQTVYSQIHFPNGPQCSGSIKQTPVNFSYQISSTNAVNFKSVGNLPGTTVTTCSSPSEKTQLDVWSISLQPFH